MIDNLVAWRESESRVRRWYTSVSVRLGTHSRLVLENVAAQSDRTKTFHAYETTEPRKATPGNINTSSCERPERRAANSCLPCTLLYL